MTCIVGIKHDGLITLGADSMQEQGWLTGVAGEDKVFKKGDFIYGGSGKLRPLSILKHKFTEPERGSKGVLKYMHTDFVEALSACFKESMWDYKIDDDGSSTKAFTDFGFLVGYQGHLFRIGHDFGITESPFGYDGAGSGRPVALGSLFASLKTDEMFTSEQQIKLFTPMEHLQIALAASDRYSLGVKKPFKFVTGGGIKK